MDPKIESTPLTLGIYDAKTRLSELIDRVASGEEVVITKHGKPVARLVAPTESRLERDKVISTLTELRELGAEVGFDLTPDEIRSTILEGRR